MEGNMKIRRDDDAATWHVKSESISNQRIEVIIWRKASDVCDDVASTSTNISKRHERQMAALKYDDGSGRNRPFILFCPDLPWPLYRPSSPELHPLAWKASPEEISAVISKRHAISKKVTLTYRLKYKQAIRSHSEYSLWEPHSLWEM